MTPVRSHRARSAAAGPALFATLLAAVLAAGAARAQYADPAFPVVDGGVYTSALSGDTLFLGGAFQHVGPNTGSFACTDAVTGVAIPFARIDGTVYAIAADAQGGWFVGGAFASVSGVPRANLARIRGDGSLDPFWNPGADGTVFSIAPASGYVFVGGAFLNAGGQSRRHVAQLNRTSGEALAWDADADSVVLTLALDSGTLWMGGRFEQVGGQQRIKMAAVHSGTGAPLAWSTTISSPGGGWPSVSAIAVDGPTVYVGGRFTSIGGRTIQNLAALDAASGLANSWDPLAGAYGTVNTIVPRGATVLLGGGFATAGGQPRANLAEVSASTALATAWNPDPDGGVRAMLAGNGRLLVGGDFKHVGGQPRANLAAIDLATGAATAWNPGAYGTVLAIGAPGLGTDTSRVVVGGARLSMGMVARSNLAAIDLASGQPTGWDPNADGFVRSMSLAGSTLYLSGAFTQVGGQPRTGLAAVDVASGIPTGWNPAAPNGQVQCVLAHGNTVYAGGGFTAIGPSTRMHLAAFDAFAGALSGWNPAADNWVNVVAAREGRVFAGGLFQSLAGSPRAYVGSVDSASALPLPWAAGASNVVDVLVPDDQDRVYVGGWFTQLGGLPRGGIARVAAATGTPDGWNPGADAPVEAIVPVGSSVYAGGFFTTIGGGTATRVAVLDAASGASVPWDPRLQSPPSTLQVADGVVYAGGNLFGAGALPLRGLVKLFPADVTAPAVQVISPNGGEYLWENGEPWHVTWTVADDQRAPWVDLQSSVGSPSGPWWPVATALPNTGVFDWLPPYILVAPAGAARGATINQTWLRIVARDLAGNVGSDESDGPFFALGTGDVPVDRPQLLLSVPSSPLRGGGHVLFHLSEPSRVRVSLFDLAGRESARLADGSYDAGWQSLAVPAWLAPGVYVARARVGERVLSRKFAILD
ncbi:MAG: delta-60 repeat domain-containing protein [Candidatus Eisenbacteria bacterium]|nr:delta-60 repeat domain-containing protein [Candidatus Eisenbacteria bacterium]